MENMNYDPGTAIRIIDLDCDGAGVQHIEFPSGEKHLRFEVGLCQRVTLVTRNPDLMKIGMAVDICRRGCLPVINLLLPWVPYARQDRVCTSGDPISIKVFATFLNSLNLNVVIIVDPHSDVATALINNVFVLPQHDVAGVCVQQLLSEGQDLALVAPDLGAIKKVRPLNDKFPQLPLICCDKRRDPITGKITGFRVLDGDPTGKHCLIVDDICDGGGTFLGLNQTLKDAGAKDQSLYVTHGLFTKGVKPLTDAFNRVYTTDSLLHVEQPENLYILGVHKWLTSF